MKPIFAWLTQSSARILVVILLIALGYSLANGYEKDRDLRRVCELLGSHDAIGQNVGADRRAIDATCLGQETDDDS